MLFDAIKALHPPNRFRPPGKRENVKNAVSQRRASMESASDQCQSEHLVLNLETLERGNPHPGGEETPSFCCSLASPRSGKTIDIFSPLLNLTHSPALLKWNCCLHFWRLFSLLLAALMMHLRLKFCNFYLVTVRTCGEMRSRLVPQNTAS